MPLVWHKLPDTTLQIVGSHPTAAVKALRSSRVEVAGTVTEQELHQRYADSLVAVVPLRVGAGVKNKVLEAMAHGIPVVTTSIGVQGLAPARDFCAVSDSADGFAESILELVHSPDRWTFASEAGRAFVGQEFSPTAMERHWAQLLDWAIETHRRPKVHLTHGR
jgi:glycosyltransferase involved in cell wall biosynthesis